MKISKSRGRRKGEGGGKQRLGLKENEESTETVRKGKMEV